MSNTSESGLLQTPRFRIVPQQRQNRWLRRFAWLVFTVAAMAGTSHLLLNPPAFLLQKPKIEPRAEPQWAMIQKPIPVYSFTGGPFERPADAYAAKRHTNGSRIDAMTYGRFSGVVAGEHDWMRMQLLRKTHGGVAAPAFYVEMARLASEEGLAVTANTFPSVVKTRFGHFAVSDLEISNGRDHAKCLGYRMQLEKPAFSVSGIACGPAKSPIDRRMLSCIIDRLDLTSSRDDRELSRFFANAELLRNDSCVNRKFAGLRNRAAWLDHVTSKTAVKSLRLTALSEHHLQR